ncbi:MAG TPA: hypothetical protein DHT34_03950 [Cellvibrionales bacterium]|nr:hypothetical protein [Cellvibrionales bacterium]
MRVFHVIFFPLNAKDATYHTACSTFKLLGFYLTIYATGVKKSLLQPAQLSQVVDYTLILVFLYSFNTLIQ